MANTKWRFVGSSEPKGERTPEEKKRNEQKAFNFTMKVKKMPVDKPKKVITKKGKENDDEIAGTC